VGSVEPFVTDTMRLLSIVLLVMSICSIGICPWSVVTGVPSAKHADARVVTSCWPARKLPDCWSVVERTAIKLYVVFGVKPVHVYVVPVVP